jgi:hypothetical protein
LHDLPYVTSPHLIAENVHCQTWCGGDRVVAQRLFVFWYLISAARNEATL